jgi:hypothetical protein
VFPYRAADVSKPPDVSNIRRFALAALAAQRLTLL